MAVVLFEDYIRRYSGLSTDVKPTTGVPPGSVFFEKDTKDLYSYDGNAWNLSNPSVQINGSVALTACGNLTLTGVAQNLANMACKSLLVQAHPLNTGYVYVGTTNGVSTTVHIAVLSPGSPITIRCANANLLWVFGNAADKISYGGEA